MRLRVLQALMVVPAVVVLGAFAVVLFRARPEAGPGRLAPSFSLPDLSSPSRRIALGSLRGQPVVMNFWASWCDPCRDEAPELARAWRSATGRVRFLGVNILDGRGEALAYRRQFGLGYASARDASGTVAKLYGVTGVPETVFIDARGRMVGKYVGAFTPGQLDAILHDLLALGPGRTLTVTGRGKTRPVP